MRILVSGASGYIGSYITHWLSTNGAEFGVISRCIPLFLQNSLGEAPFYKADIEALPALKLNEPYDVLVHLASANDIDSIDPRVALLTTGYGARMAVELCKSNSIPRVIYFSTFQVYGTNIGTVDEATKPHCLNDYALSHLIGEEYIHLAQNRGEIESIIFRPTNIYGAPLTSEVDRWSLVPGCFCKEAVESGIITLQSSGNQVRDFLSLEDITKLTYFVCEKFDTWKNQTINLASGHVHSIREIADLTAKIFLEVTGKVCRMNINSDQPINRESLYVNTQKLNGLPYSCEDTMETEIRKTFNLLGLLNEPK